MQWQQMPSKLSLFMIIALLIAACGGISTAPQGETGSTGDAGDTAEQGETGDSEVAPEPSGDGDAVTIRWRTRPSDAAEQAVYEGLNEIANEQLADQNIVVEYDPGVNQGYFEKLKTELAAGNAPDIFWIGAAELADFVATEQILDLQPLADNDSEFNLDDFYEQPISQLSRDGKLYGLPRDISTMVTYYNVDMFEEAGLPTPAELAAEGNWTLDTMLETAQQLTDPDQQRYGLGFGNWWGPAWGYFVNASGGSIFNADGTACALNTPEAVAGATLVQTLYNEELIPVGDADSEALFNAGNVGMYFNGRWFAPGVRTNAEFNWDVAEMPMGEQQSTWLFWGPYLVNTQTESPEAAWEVLKILTSVEAMSQVAQEGTNIPARTNQEAVDVFLASTPPENNQAYIAGTEYAVAEAPLWGGSWADYSGTVQSLWDQMIAGQITPEEFGQQACEQTTGAFSQ